jgi:hypothetical protein
MFLNFSSVLQKYEKGKYLKTRSSGFSGQYHYTGLHIHSYRYHTDEKSARAIQWRRIGETDAHETSEFWRQFGWRPKWEILPNLPNPLLIPQSTA